MCLLFLARYTHPRRPLLPFSLGCTNSRLFSERPHFDYQALRKEYEDLRVPLRFNFAQDVFDKWAKCPQGGKRVALWHVGRDGSETKLTYSQLALESQHLANGLGNCSRVLILVSRSMEWWVTNLAAIRMGSVLYPGSIQLTEKDLTFRLQASQPDCLMAEWAATERLDAALDKIREQFFIPRPLKVVVGSQGRPRGNGWTSYEEVMRRGAKSVERPTANTLSADTVQMFFTSGTTGAPKMVPQSHANYYLGFKATAELWLDLKPEDLHWNIADTGWAKTAYSNVFSPWLQGCTVFVHAMERFEAGEVLRTLSCFPITTLCAPPTSYRAMLQLGSSLCKESLPSLRSCVSAGEPLGAEAMSSWKKATGLDVREGYGQTESTLLVGTLAGMEVRPGSMGLPAPGYDVRMLREEDLTETDVGEEGHLAVKVEPKWPLGLFRGYANTSTSTSTPDCFRGGFYFTGDKAYRDEDGYLWFVGRSDDVIISSGYRIGPFEVEFALSQHPAVSESAVVSSPDPIRGEVVKAFVVLAPGFKERDQKALSEELQTHVKRMTAPYKYPRKIEFREALPKTVSGKVRRSQLRKEEWDGSK